MVEPEISIRFFYCGWCDDGQYHRWTPLGWRCTCGRVNRDAPRQLEETLTAVASASLARLKEQVALAEAEELLAREEALRGRSEAEEDALALEDLLRLRGAASPSEEPKWDESEGFDRDITEDYTDEEIEDAAERRVMFV